MTRDTHVFQAKLEDDIKNGIDPGVDWDGDFESEIQPRYVMCPERIRSLYGIGISL